MTLATTTSQLAWFCLRSQPKHEHIAAQHLRRQANVEVFLPRIRFRRSSRRGPMWVTEALFPNYLFARLDWKTALPRVHYAPGVRGVIHFGDRWPTIPDETLEELRCAFGADQVHVMDAGLSPGDEVQIAGGVFHGLQAVITQLMPGRDRVRLLLDFLGRQATVEAHVGSVVKRTRGQGWMR
jgi:transcriptional antiterminator RfaH